MPRVYAKLGPLVHVWSMRYEAKHKFFKSSLKNFKNITKSFAKKHQIAVAYHWESLSSKGIESGPIKLKKLTDVEHGDLISEHFQIDVSSEVSVTTWVKCNDIEFHTGLVVCTDFIDKLPMFKKIVCILLGNKVNFWVTEMETTFVENVHAFHVVENVHNVSVVASCEMSYGTDSSFYIVPDGCIF